MKKIVTNTFEETQQVGLTFAKELRGGEVIALYGNLGAGKTTFMQGLAKGLGITRNIISPTFIIMRTYEVSNNDIRTLYHLDLYRIENDEQAVDLGLNDLMGEKDNIVAIEWPDKIENILPEKRINIYFEYLGDDKREIRLD
ncbi:MAG TPA: tRNA (adenosine(37)-N6)-threonylcarbamoyltransferase complex ATPase subunit type 1 TsaE [Candidatus Saccharimonadales bacterium]|nr:tRNA (adenosine(37)-N6)-threonylcarbamoyltransferase complex ATPase subunit type 1 TsaE [Candidatus Saccharimonadales bacterium]